MWRRLVLSQRVVVSVLSAISKRKHFLLRTVKKKSAELCAESFDSRGSQSIFYRKWR